MNLAKISSNGQITIPVEIRHKLNLKEGDKILFLEKASGEIVVQNSSLLAIREAQAELKDVGISEDEIIDEIMKIRYSSEKDKMI